MTTVEIILWLVTAFWFAIAMSGVWNRLAVHELPGALPAPGGPRPRVSVVVAARDEARRIETTVRRLLDQQGVDLEVIVVDDRSTDETPAILARIGAERPELHARRVDVLPPGWLGKCHAMHVGASRAVGDWILFTDADVWLTPHALARAVAAAERERAAHVVVLPGFSETSFMGKAAMLTCVAPMARHIARVNRDRRRAYIGAGAFNLVRADAYRAIGGHTSLRMEVVDDLKLGLLLAAAGKRSRAYSGVHDVEVEWGGTVPGIVAVLRKNAFAIVGFNPLLAALALLLVAGPWALALLGPLTGTLPGFAAPAALWSTALPAWLFAREFRWPRGAALVAPLMWPVLPVAMALSMVAVLREGGVRWRGTLYRTADLRAGLVRWPEGAAEGATVAE